MTARLVITGRLAGLNEYVAAERANRYKGAQMKRDAQVYVEYAIKRQMHGVRFSRPVRLRYLFVEPNKKRDKDNIAAFGHKVIQDALVEMGVLDGDGWAYIEGYVDDFAVDRVNPRIEVTIEEVAIGQEGQ